STSTVEYQTPELFETSRLIAEDPALSIEHLVTITNLHSATKYIYIIKSTDAQGNTAVSPRLFVFETAEEVDVLPPVIFGKPHPAERDTDRVVIQWVTNEPATSIVEFAEDSLFDDENNRTFLTNLTLNDVHFVSLFGLKPDTKYRYRVGSEDAFGNGPTFSDTEFFKTLEGADTEPPVIFGFPEVRNIDTSTTAIRWFTNERASRRVDYYPEGDEASVLTKDDQTLSRVHTVILSDLASATTYIFIVSSTDSKGNTVQKGPFIFVTPVGLDVIPPSFKRFPAIVNIDTASFVMEWFTDEPTNGILEYFLVSDPSDTNSIDDPDLRFRHVIFSDGLTPETEYSVRVLSFDQAGNGPLVSEWFIVKTRGRPDLNPPRVTGFPVTIKSDTTSVTIGWLTDEAAVSEFEYGFASEWPNNKSVEILTDFRRKHELTLTNLSPDSLFFYWVRVIDRVGNISAFSPLSEFRTRASADILPPEFIGLVGITEIDTGQAIVRWRTNEASNSVVEISREGSGSSNTRVLVEQELTNNHRILVKELDSGTEYRVRVKSTDSNGNESEFSAEFFFRTRTSVDTNPPLIFGQPTERDVDTTSVTIVFGTNEPSKSLIEMRETADTTQSFSIIDGELIPFHRIFVSDLLSDTEYEYRVKASDANNNSSPFTGYQRFRTLASPDLTPPRVTSDPIVIGLTHQSASVKFKTNEVSYVSVIFGSDSSNLRFAEPELEGKTTHVVRLTELVSATKYYYQIVGRDIKGNSFLFPPEGRKPLSFRTKIVPVVQDTSLPKVIAGPIELDIEPNAMTIIWQTNVLANTVIEFGTDTSLTEKITQDNETTVFRHRVHLSDLLADTTYFYRLRGQGLNNREFLSALLNINTPAVRDTFPARISQGPIVNFIASDFATIGWKTDKNASSRVDFGVDSNALDRFTKADEIEGVTRHLVKLTELLQDTVYFYRVSSVAGNGRESTSRMFNFRTRAAADVTPPQILAGPDATAVTNNTAIIEWETDELSTSKVTFGLRTTKTGADLSEVIWIDDDAEGVLLHKAVLTGLAEGAEYVFRVSSNDLSPVRNEVVSRVKRFTTVAALDSVPPVLVAGPIVDFSDKTATFEWETDELSDSIVLIRIKGVSGAFRKIGDLTKVTKHIITVTNLNPNKEYEFELASRDLASNLFTWPTQNNGGSLQKFAELRKTAQ
ncbi:fibronectin type III domain-containing protein, partial [candidate division KSB1 bacterium]|nr:fibronectin type III domain-containing protein [candidate division KSB1 bacterium]